jgi:hypothetical protein
MPASGGSGPPRERPDLAGSGALENNNSCPPGNSSTPHGDQAAGGMTPEAAAALRCWCPADEAPPEYMIPFVPILERGEEPFSMFRDLWIKHRQWVLDPIRYPSVDRLIEVLDTKIIKPAQARFVDLLALKAEELRIEDV